MIGVAPRRELTPKALTPRLRHGSGRDRRVGPFAAFLEVAIAPTPLTSDESIA
jgi:hypothetical protein